MRRQSLRLTLVFFALLSPFINTGAGAPTVTRSVQVEVSSWPMAGANPERTSWTAEEVRGELKPLWYRPFEPYISQKVQIIAAYNTLYIATAKGLYALDAGSGAQRWVYPTELPLGHSPTVQNGVVYVGGFDHKLHAIDAFSGQGLWTFEAGAGFETNPLVVAGKVYAGNRDGFFYAVYTEGAQTGQLAWKYPTQGPILFSAAYKDGVVYFASQDSHAYALNAQTGTLVWKSAKLPGAGFHSFWPVVYQDRVIFAGSHNYRSSSRFSPPGKNPILEWDDVYPNRQRDPDGIPVGPLGQQVGPWVPGTPTLDTSRPNVTANGQTTPITEYFEQKPWRRTDFVLDRHTGQEVTYDFDQDGRPEYAPFLWFGTHSGNRYPPVVGGDGVIYQSNDFQSSPAIPWGHITGWKLDTPFISLPAPGRNAVDEPQGYSAGGNLIYWNRCCDRVGAAFDITQPGTAWTYFSFDLDRLLPGYNNRYYNPAVGHYTDVFASFGGPNGVYGFHADTNPPIPYQGKVYMHRSNAVIAFGASNSPPIALPLARTIAAPPPALTPFGPEALKARLAQEIEKMLAAGHLRPGYASHGHFDLPSEHQCGDELGDYFHNPAETIVTLIQALPHLSPDLQARVKAYLQNEFTAYPPYRYNHIGWQQGAAREIFDLPPEVEAARVSFPPQEGTSGFVWSSNPYGFYGLWKYAELMNDPHLAQQLLVDAQSNKALMDSLTTVPGTTVLAKMPFVHNAYIAGYLGYLGLERLAGQGESLPMRQELERLMQLRASQFSKDSPYAHAALREEGAYCRTLNVAGNFMFLVPELGQYLHDHALVKVQGALAEYEQIAPYWFVSFAEEGFGENALSPLYDGQALFLAKAWILGEPGVELEKYLDVPAFARGDLFFLQKLVAAIENYHSVETSVHIDGQEMQGSPFGLAPGIGIRKSFSGINAGPVKIEGNVDIVAAERVIYKAAGGVNTSFSEMMGLPANQLDNIYWLPWYNNKDLDTQLRFANVTNQPASVHVFIGGAEMAGSSFTLLAGESTRQSFTNINGGPVQIVSDQNIVAAERVIYTVSGKQTSFSEMMALPNGQLDHTYWLPWYNNIDLDTQLRFANTTNTTASVHIFIGGAEMTGSPFTLQPGESTRQSFTNINGGPVQIVSDQNIVAAERVIYTVSGKQTSFSEMMALPNGQLDHTYWLPWYNNIDLDTQLRFANTTNTTASVHIFIGGAEMTGSPFTLQPGESTRQSFANINGGPVQIVSDQNIVAAERVIYKVNNVNTSFSEMMALPNRQLDHTYWLPWYNNIDLDTQLRFGMPLISGNPLGPTIRSITSNLADYPSGRVLQYEKFELTFDVDTVAENLQLPYDPTPPPGLKPGIGITVNALFSPDGWQTVYTQPAFYYQEFQYEIKGGKEWLYPTNDFAWKVRFAPNQIGDWQYELVAQDASGATETSPQTFTVTTSDNKGFVRVSQSDARYFEYDDGAYFPGLGYNMNVDHLSWTNPRLDNEENFQIMSQNGIQLIRIWLSQWAIYGSEWNPWSPQNPELHKRYYPYTGITFEDAVPESEVSMKLEWDQNPCMVYGLLKPKPAVKRNTDYRIRIRYKMTGLTGPRIPGFPHGFVAKTGGYLWGPNNYCYDPGVGTIVTPHLDQNTAGWEILEGSINSGDNDFLPNFFLTLDNVNSGTVYVDYVWIQEDLGNGQYGPNIVPKPWMAHHLYMEQRNSYAFDKVLDLAKQYGIYLRLVIHEKNEWIFNNIDYAGNPILNNPRCWDGDPSNDPEECPGNPWFYGNLREMTKVRWLQQAWWRYLQARWGYSTNIHSWELLNEGDPTSELHYTLADEFGKYMHQFRPNDHLVSTSNWIYFPKDRFWANPEYPHVDFADYHGYIKESDPLFIDTAQATYETSMRIGANQPDGPGKPVIRGETGFVVSDGGTPTTQFQNDAQGVWLHNFIWGSINAGGMIDSYFYENIHIYSKNRDGTYIFDHRDQYGPYYNFISNIPLNNGDYQDAQAVVSNDQLRAWGQKDLVHGCADLWLQNKNHTWKNVVDGVSISGASGTVGISGFRPNESYTIAWWDPYQTDRTQQIIGRDLIVAQANGTISIPIADLLTDVALEIIASNGCS